MTTRPTGSREERATWVEWLPERRWHYRRSLASRIALLTTLAVALTLSFAALAAYLVIRQQMQANLDRSLLDRAEVASRQDLSQIQSGGPTWLFGASDLQIYLVVPDPSSDGEVRYVAQRANVVGPELTLGKPELEVATRQESVSIRTQVAGGTRHRVVAVPVESQSGTALVLAESMESYDRVLGRIGVVMLALGGAGVITALLAGWGVARNGLRPVRRLTAAAEHIARTEDLTPLDIEGDDELARLATSFNHMLAALAASRDRQRQLVADAGHELRTPLTSLRTNLDLLVQVDSGEGPQLPPEARTELLDDIGAQLEELTTLIGDLVELARDEPPESVRDSVELIEVVERATARVRRRAPGLTFELDLTPCTTVGEFPALERAATNLLDNAAKWSPAGGTVHVHLRDGVLTVDDEGDGIAAEDRPHVFDRFYRSTESRGMPGSGLGLSIVHQVALRHGGSVEVETSPSGGARLILRLPVSGLIPEPPEPAGDQPLPRFSRRR